MSTRKPRRVFDAELLRLSAVRDEAELKEVPEVCKSGTQIEFDCRCGTSCKKRFDCAVDYGFFCVPCRKKSTVERNESTKLTKLNAPLIITDTYKLVLNNVVEEIVRPDDHLTLCLAPYWRKGIVAQTSKGYVVAWWDDVILNMRQKSFSITSQLSKVAAFDAAKQLAASCTNYNESHRVKARVADVVVNLSRFAYYCRVPAEINQYVFREVPLEAWMLGSWLGDGTYNKAAISNVDPEVLSEWRAWSEKHDLKFISDDNITWIMSSGVRQQGSNAFINLLRKIGVFGQKHIPDLYKQNSVEIRKELLAGILDADGCLTKGNSYEFTQSLDHERLYDDVREIVKSLGLRMTKSHTIKTCVYNGQVKHCPAVRGTIIGNADILSSIPLRISYKRHSAIQKARHDLYRFTIVPQLSTET